MSVQMKGKRIIGAVTWKIGSTISRECSITGKSSSMSPDGEQYPLTVTTSLQSLTEFNGVDVGSIVSVSYTNSAIQSVTFKGVHFEILVDVDGFIWMIQTTEENHKVGETIGMYIEPDAIHIMNRSEYSGEFGDYSSFSDEMDHISDAQYNWEEENEE